MSCPRLTKPAPASVAWALPFTAASVALAAMGAQGLVSASTPVLSGCICALCAGLALALFREPVFAAAETRLASLKKPRTATLVRVVAAIALLAAATVASDCALELPWNANYLPTVPGCLSLELGIIALVLCALYFAGQGHGAAVGLGVAGFFVLGLAQYFVLIFKDSAIRPSDLLSLGTAAAVAGGYTYVLEDGAIAGVTSLALGLIVCLFIRPIPSARPRRRIAANLGCCCACVAVLVGGYATVSFSDNLGITVDSWVAIYSYMDQGILPGLISSFQNLAIEKPEGYSDERAQELEGLLAASYEAGLDAEGHAAPQEQFASVQPSVIVVMNESFADLSSLDGLGVGYEGPTYFNSIDDGIARGSLAVSAYGGGTCNSEFEFLSGSSLAYVGAGMYPYTFYNLSGIASLPKQFASLGYETCAIHPNLGTNWNRETIYAQLGFDEFLTIDDFEGAPSFHSGVTDRATYETILERLRSSDSPQLIFDVTMQNHSSYDQNNIDSSLLRGLAPSYLSTSETAQLNEYLACIDASDADLAWLIGELRELERPVVLVFFGDHQPSLGNITDALYPNDTNETAHGMRNYQTSYLVWANYDVAGTGEMRWEDASTSTLAALALDAIGAPLTSYQKAQLGARASVPMLNFFAYKDNDGSWHSVAEASGGEAGGSADGDSAEAESAAESARTAFLELAYVQYQNFAEIVQ